MADRVAAFGGSWTFIILFVIIMVAWMIYNLVSPQKFDVFPFIFLNLVLSCLAALQAPVIMMSQNRQSDKDRLNAQLDYEVNLKISEMEVMALHTKVDELRERNLTVDRVAEAASGIAGATGSPAGAGKIDSGFAIGGTMNV